MSLSARVMRPRIPVTIMRLEMPAMLDAAARSEPIECARPWVELIESTPAEIAPASMPPPRLIALRQTSTSIEMAIAEATVETTIVEVATETPIVEIVAELTITNVSVMSIAMAVVVRVRGEWCGQQQTNGQTTQQSFHVGSPSIA